MNMPDNLMECLNKYAVNAVSLFYAQIMFVSFFLLNILSVTNIVQIFRHKTAISK